MLFFEKFQSKEDDEEENPSWLYPLLYTLLAIFISVLSAFFGFWLYKKKNEYNLYRSEGSTKVIESAIPQINPSFFSYNNPQKKNNKKLKKRFQNFASRYINNNLGPNTPQYNYNQRAGKYKKNKISIKRRR
jgi:hypothetical protein